MNGSEFNPGVTVKTLNQRCQVMSVYGSSADTKAFFLLCDIPCRGMTLLGLCVGKQKEGSACS